MLNFYCVFAGIYLPTLLFKAGIAGFHDSRSERDFELPYSGTFYVHHLTTSSNFEKNGLFIYRIDEKQIIGMF